MEGLFYVDLWASLNDEPLVAVNIKEKEVSDDAIYERIKAVLKRLTLVSKDITIVSNLDKKFFEEKQIKDVVDFFKIKIEEPSEDYLSYLMSV